MTAISLFSGIAGIELGLQLVIPDLRTLYYVEQDKYCRQVLQARMRDGWLHTAPIHEDVRTFDGSEWRGRCDLICGGFPCQDISNAGRREGVKEGNRSGLWFEFARIIRAVGPRYVFLENVAALANRGLDIVLGALADSGYDAEWDVFSAAEVGAPHLRKRLFVLAYAECQGPQGGTWQELPGIWGPSEFPAQCHTPVADTIGFSGERRGDASDLEGQSSTPQGEARQREWGGDTADHRLAGVLGNPDEFRLSRRNSDRADGRPATHPGGAGFLFPPGPADSARWQRYLEAQPGLEPSVCRSTPRLPHRVDRLRCLGNSVLPLVAAHAFSTLLTRIGAHP